MHVGIYLSVNDFSSENTDKWVHERTLKVLLVWSGTFHFSLLGVWNIKRLKHWKARV